MEVDVDILHFLAVFKGIFMDISQLTAADVICEWPLILPSSTLLYEVITQWANGHEQYEQRHCQINTYELSDNTYEIQVEIALVAAKKTEVLKYR